MPVFFLFVEELCQLLQFFLLIGIPFIVEAFAELFEGGLYDPVMRQGFEIGCYGWYGNSFEIAVYVLVREDLAAHGVDEELDTLLRAEPFGVFVVGGLYIGQYELAGDIDRLNGNIQQF